MSDAKPFGVNTGTRSVLCEGDAHLAVMRTADGVTHYIRVVSRQSKWLRYVLRHDQKEYLIMVTTIEVHDEHELVTCVICLAKGPERPEEDAVPSD